MEILSYVIGSASSVEVIEAAISTYLRNKILGKSTNSYPLCSSNQMDLSRRGLILSQSLKFSCENRILQSFPEVERSTHDLQAILDTCIRYSGHGPVCLIPYAMYASSFDESQALVPIPDLVMVWSRLSKYSTGVPRTIISDDDIVSHLICNALPHFVPNLSEISYAQLDALCFDIGYDTFFATIVGPNFQEMMTKSIANLLWDHRPKAAQVISPAGPPKNASAFGRIIYWLKRGLVWLSPIK